MNLAESAQMVLDWLHLSKPSKVPAWGCVATAILGLLVYEQLDYRRKKGPLPGPSFKIPIIGSMMDSMCPTFEKYHDKWESGELSCVSVFNRFIVIASTCELSRKILNAPHEYVEPAVVDSMKYILCDDNWVFLQGKAHRVYRKGLNHLFQRKALGTYLPIQQKVYQKHFAQWLALNGNIEEYQWQFRYLNLDSSLRVFIGNFMSDAVVHQIYEEYNNITAALELVNFPIPLPGTNVYKAIQSRKFIVKWFLASVKDGRERMANGGEITCLMDAWLVSMKEAQEEAERLKKPAPRNFTDREIALTIITFLFASQDATSSALTWAFQLLADHPDVLEKVRQEQATLDTKDVTLERMDKSVYLRQVVKEILRLRPPVLMGTWTTKCEVFHIEQSKIGQLLIIIPYPKTRLSYVAMIIPTTYPSLHDPNAYPDQDKFDPDRWGPDGIAEKHPQNFLCFGLGPHHCIGKEYAIMHLMSTIAQACLQLDWIHHRTDKSDHISLFATTYPTDGCLLSFSPRKTA
ncbi:RNA polymerase C-22 sterol desaturase [Apophysomyces ossiformis]|uniref:sterol 22-desaturase n=1 Tax=Apophysomyces ossiformis TaxID=679940 RepID=A0A8H7BY14_9FUNG|nr:RNA polymerase C-22 sterol desaturase [Apophysomyces ossiformis]